MGTELDVANLIKVAKIWGQEIRGLGMIEGLSYRSGH